MKKVLAWGLLLAVVPAMVAAQGAPRPPDAEAGFERHLFPPELIMQHRRALNITNEQRAAITTAIRELQSRILELQWQLQDESERLGALLTGERIDEAAALEQIDRMLRLEDQVKRAHLQMLIRIRNALTPKQVQQLEALKRHARSPDGPGQ